ncbi:hypothetical protein [Aeromonas rivipollensis]
MPLINSERAHLDELCRHGPADSPTLCPSNTEQARLAELRRHCPTDSPTL